VAAAAVVLLVLAVVVAAAVLVEASARVLVGVLVRALAHLSEVPRMSLQRSLASEDWSLRTTSSWAVKTSDRGTLYALTRVEYPQCAI
jgi:hypothetical protein